MKKFLLLMMGMLMMLPAMAFQYEYEGNVVTYNVLDKDEKTAEVVWSGDNEGKVSGDLVIPEVVYDGDNAYTVVKIGQYAFSLNTEAKITSLTLPNTITEIESSAFNYCRDLKTVYLGTSLKTIGRNAFKWTALTDVTFPETLESIGDGAFEDTNISWLIIPENVKYIGYHAFYKCSNLFSIMFCGKELELDDFTFYETPYLNKVAFYPELQEKVIRILGGDKSYWTIEEGEIVDAEKGIIWGANASTAPWVSGKYEGYIEIPSEVTELYWVNMAECPGITEVVLPEGLEMIGDQAFFHCSGLTNVVMSKNLKSIGNYAFTGCSVLANIILPESVETIGSHAFYDCKGLTEITIPRRVAEIGDYAFTGVSISKAAVPESLKDSQLFYNPDKLFYYDNYDAYTENGFVFSRSKDKLIYVPYSVSSEYTVPETVKEITDEAFYNCENLTELELPVNLEKLGEKVWTGCKNITVVKNPNPTPVEGGKETFEASVVDKATLMVPLNTKAEYEKVSPWKYFYNIEEMDFSGVEVVAAEGNGEVVVYDLNGCNVGKSVEGLHPGIYIKRQGSKVEKILVK